MQGKNDRERRVARDTFCRRASQSNSQEAKSVLRLGHVIEYGTEEDLNHLLNAGCDVNASLGLDGWPLLCCAVARGQSQIVDLLLNHGADPNQTVAGGTGAGMVALDFCQDVSTAQKLLRAGARLDVRDGHGWTPIEWASHMQRGPLTALFDQ